MIRGADIREPLSGDLPPIVGSTEQSDFTFLCGISINPYHEEGRGGERGDGCGPPLRNDEAGSAAPFSLPDYPPRIKMTRGARRIVTITRIVLPAPRRMRGYPARGN